MSAAVANALIYALAAAAGAMPAIEIRPGQPITLAAVIGTTVASVAGATGLLALLLRFTRQPQLIFTTLAVLVLLLSFVTPLTIPGAPIPMIVALEVMHIVTAAIAVYLLAGLPDREETL